MSDLLGVRHPIEAEPVPKIISPTEAAVAKPLVGLADEGVDIQIFEKHLVERGRPQEAKTMMRLTRGELLTLIGQRVKSLNE